MAGEAPPFWWQKPSAAAYALYVPSLLYGAVASWRLSRAPRKPVGAPVLCIGNFTVGGSGKTPVALAIAEAARGMGWKPGFLSRGHGGSATRVKLVDPAGDSASFVGDEPLILAERAPTAIGADRAAAADLLLSSGDCDFLIMDDGFQSSRIAIDHAVLVVDARYGIGNGHVIPAGPLRAPLVHQMRFADSLLIVGRGHAADHVLRAASKAGRAVFRAQPITKDAASLRNRKLYAFAGIGIPEKFFDSLDAAGAWLAGTRAFGDHHAYTREEMAELLAETKSGDIRLATTRKDSVRLHGHGDLAERILTEAIIVDMEIAFESATTPGRMIEQAVKAFRKRSFDVR